MGLAVRVFFVSRNGAKNVLRTEKSKKSNLFVPDILKNNSIDFSYASKGSDISLYNSNKTVMEQFYKLGSIVSSPFIANNIVYFGSTDGNCYAIELQKEN